MSTTYDDDDDPPTHLRCPITLDLLQDPHLALDGHTYSRHAITAWLCHRSTSPMTNLRLSAVLIPNRALQTAVESYDADRTAARIEKRAAAAVGQKLRAKLGVERKLLLQKCVELEQATALIDELCVRLTAAGSNAKPMAMAHIPAASAAAAVRVDRTADGLGCAATGKLRLVLHHLIVLVLIYANANVFVAIYCGGYILR